MCESATKNGRWLTHGLDWRSIPSLSLRIKLRHYKARSPGERILIHKRGVCILCANFVGHGEQGSELGRIEAWISAGFL